MPSDEEEKVREEVWGDAELGAVLKDAAAQWGKDVGYKNALNEWVMEHVDKFEEHIGCDVDSCEHKIEYQGLHEEYLALFESQITKFVKREDYTAEDFFTECRASLDDYGCALFEEHEEKWFVEALLSATDYFDWFRMMIKAAEGSRK
jgi:hypothetical protein